MSATRSPTMTRRRWLAGVAAAAVGATAIDALAIEPERLAITQHRFGAAIGRTLRVVQLSDLHLRRVGRHEERIAAAVASLRPELLVITGDSIDRRDDLPLLDGFLALLDGRPTTLAILGNWEHAARVDLAALRATYARHGCQLLRNESTTLDVGGARLLVTGIDDLVEGTPDVGRALRDVAPAANHLLLAHCPMHREVYRAWTDATALPLQGAPAPAIDPRLLSPTLMLAGHTHGGQIAPFGWAPVRPRGSGRYVRGWYRDSPTAMYVSRGIGMSGIPARLGSEPEVAEIAWTLA